MEKRNEISVTKLGKEEEWSVELSHDEIAFLGAGDPTRYIIPSEDFHVKAYTTKFSKDNLVLHAPVPKKEFFKLTQEQFDLVNQYLGSPTKPQLEKFLKTQGTVINLVAGIILVIGGVPPLSGDDFAILPLVIGGALVVDFLLCKFLIIPEVLLLRSIFASALAVAVTYGLMKNGGSPWWGWLFLFLFLFMSKGHWGNYKRFRKSKD